MRAAVIDLGYGDSGKGITTSYLCSTIKDKLNTIVIRFNGGHQAGHTVVHNGFRHVFSQFGSGALHGIPTYISKTCTIYPPSLMREYDYIKDYNSIPALFIDPLTMITTPFDIDFNRNREKKLKHGSVGMGFGQTIQRNEDFYKLYFQDLFFEKVLREKLWNIGFHYYNIPDDTEELQTEIDAFVVQCKLLTNSIWCLMKNCIQIENQFINRIYESAQGIMLHQDYGFFPNVTRSKTCTSNIYDLHPFDPITDVYYVFRCYQTRHGNGFMTRENEKPVLINNENETNKSHVYQGEFRTGELDIEMLKYAILCDNHNHRSSSKFKFHLVITCLDQRPGFDYHSVIDELADFCKNLPNPFMLSSVLGSYSPDAKDFKILA